MKLLLTHGYFLRLDEKQWSLQEPYPPLATLYAASELKREGFEVIIQDPMFEKSTDFLNHAIIQNRPELVIIYDDVFNYLTKMCTTVMRNAVFDMIEIAKMNKLICVIAGSDASDHPDMYLKQGADFIIKGEGEKTVSELVRAIAERKENWKAIPGICFMEGDRMIKTESRPVMKELDKLGLPDWDSIDLKPYVQAWKKKSGYLSLNISTTRGCPFHCNWCAKPIYGNRYHVHSPEYTLNQINKLQKVFGAEHFWITDDIFGLKPGWTSRFAELVSESGARFRYKIQSRADLLCKEGTVKELAGSGCETVWIGAESGSQKILDAMDKGIRVEQIYEANKLLRKHGIRPAFFLQFGYPGEDMNDINLTIKMLEELMPEDIGISISYPLPGTVFHDKVKEELSNKANWTDSDDLDLMFQNTYPAEFYKNLQRYIHRRYRSRQALRYIGKALKKPFRIKAPELLSMCKAPAYIAGSIYYKRKLLRNTRDSNISFKESDES
ncbi:MAG: radical SAM protein [Bacteroidetes bacterium]|nr:MAG: radical SAM protein [Bacteroidota bacterium]REK04769.1 MAG: radical SAM protein [Bacteroidota bacterium]REK36243.1 MAG: radical SAM protein [Bacteroidota bacterium]REK51095.1 MAG: radical SAM protein [Bacteroidota bacterium]